MSGEDHHPDRVGSRRKTADPRGPLASQGSTASLLAGSWALEAVELDSAGDVDRAGPVLAGGEVTGLLGGPEAGPVGAAADEEARVEDLERLQITSDPLDDTSERQSPGTCLLVSDLSGDCGDPAMVGAPLQLANHSQGRGQSHRSTFIAARKIAQRASAAC